MGNGGRVKGGKSRRVLGDEKESIMSGKRRKG